MTKEVKITEIEFVGDVRVLIQKNLLVRISKKDKKFLYGLSLRELVRFDKIFDGKIILRNFEVVDESYIEKHTQVWNSEGKI